jgi:membrane protease YdiL (CAAX protease family)
MNGKQRFFIITPLVVIVLMYPIFQILARVFGENWRTGWFLGLLIYWLTWGAVFPVLIIGKQKILTMIRPQRPNSRILLFVAFPLLMASLYRLIPGMKYDKAAASTLLMLVATAFGNGFFEEILWRGVSMQLFPENIFFRLIWPSIWFALWHYAPGSVSPSGNVIGLMVGSGFFGFYLSYLAKRTNGLFWCIVAHTLGGIIMVV